MKMFLQTMVGPYAQFEFDNGWSVIIHPHSLDCSAVSVLPCIIAHSDRDPTREETEKYSVDPYYYPHASDDDVASIFARVKDWPIEPMLQKSADVTAAAFKKAKVQR